MSKRTVFTTISPLPAGVSRQVVLAFLHNHLEMIDLNPLVKERHPIHPPAQHMHEDERNCVWYSLTDQIDYIPGGKISGDVVYTCSFHDLSNGIQTHCRAALGVDIREKWTLCGSLPGEPPEPVELGLGAPSSGLYLREDCDLRCPFIMTSFVKKNLKRSHATLVQRLVEKSRVLSSESASEPASFPLAMPWSPPKYAPSSGLGHAPSTSSFSSSSSSSSSTPPPPLHARPASYNGHPVAELGASPPPQLATNVWFDAYQTHRAPSPQIELQRNRGSSTPESPKWRPYSHYDTRSQPPPHFPFALRIPVGPPPPPPPAERPNDNFQPAMCPPLPPKEIDSALCPTPLRVRGLSVGSNNTISSMSTTSAASPSTLTHASSVRSVSSAATSFYNNNSSSSSSNNRASCLPVRIIAPPEQHPEYPMLNPYGPRSAGSSGESSPVDEEQPNTPDFPTGQPVGGPSLLRGCGISDEWKHHHHHHQQCHSQGGIVDHPAILRPGFGATMSMSSRLSGPFLAELE